MIEYLRGYMYIEYGVWHNEWLLGASEEVMEIKILKFGYRDLSKCFNENSDDFQSFPVRYR